jgi:hypothetical protein
MLNTVGVIASCNLGRGCSRTSKATRWFIHGFCRGTKMKGPGKFSPPFIVRMHSINRERRINPEDKDGI